MSVQTSPSVSPQAPSSVPKRRLSARRGSQTAPDPFNTHADLNYHAGRSTSSRLTIVRVVPDAPAEEHAGAPGSPVSRRHSLQHRRTGSGPGDGQRMSFASSSFSRPGGGSSSGSRPGSPTLNRPRSPGPMAQRHSLPARTRFTPDDIVRLAREACNPQYNPAMSSSASSKAGSTSNSPLASPVVGTTGAPAPPATAPASFTALPDDIWLPFVDRAAEVSTLMSTHPTARLFALLAQTLPVDSTSFTPPKGDDDSAQWTYAQLDHWLRHVDREEADDRLWVRRARACVLAHSELIWERIKGALGVPPELDTDQAPAPAPEPLHMGDANPFESDPEDLVEDVFDEVEVAIEPVVVPTTPPVVAAAGDLSGGLGDIGEEDEEEAAEEAADGADAPAPALAPPREEIVQGLRISTAPQPPPSAYPMSPSAMFPHSPVPVSARDDTSPAASLFHLDSQAPAGSDKDIAPAAAGMAGYSRRERSYSASSHGSSRSGYYDAVAERGPGNPIFPSSFARLALAPTLSANNPALRAPNPPPMSAYGIMRTGSGGVPSLANPAIPRRGGWAEGFDIKNEYAVTTASGSSIPGDMDR